MDYDRRARFLPVACHMHLTFTQSANERHLLDEEFLTNAVIVSRALPVYSGRRPASLPSAFDSGIPHRPENSRTTRFSSYAPSSPPKFRAIYVPSPRPFPASSCISAMAAGLVVLSV
jgi:hypothetical protein